MIIELINIPQILELGEIINRSQNGKKKSLDEFSNSNANSFVSALPSSVINKSILARITLDPVQYPIGSLMPANQYNGRLLSDTRTYNGTVDLQKMKLQLIHDDGLPVNLNGLDFSFSLEIQYE